MSTQPAELVKISEIATEYRVAPDTVLRWVRRGLKIDGEIVRLEGVRIGGRWYVTRQAAVTWWRRLNHFAEVVEPAREVRRQSHQRALAELKAKWGLAPDPERARAKDGRIGRRKEPGPA